MKKQQGFTLIELVIVVIILGLLGAAAVPRFLDATDDARDASVEGVAGGFASAVGLVRAEWELAGRPSGTTDVDYDGVSIDVTDTGYPAGTSDDNDSNDDLNSLNCSEVFNAILASPPTITYPGQAYDEQRYIATYYGTDDLCVYTQTGGSATEITGANVPNNYNSDYSTGQGFTYDADSGAVRVFRN
ncbi:MAG: type II secretion system protein [Gammaproteobacteria bacterium]|nr:type II secretion system protein [Gammaproteobacteria bacterium]